MLAPSWNLGPYKLRRTHRAAAVCRVFVCTGRECLDYPGDFAEAIQEWSKQRGARRYVMHWFPSNELEVLG